MKIAINYANDRFLKQQKYNTKTAYKKGKFDKVIEYGPNNIDIDFYKKYSYLVKQTKGSGYWIWKPYIIHKTLNEISIGDYLFYCDSGAYYINKIDYLIECMENSKQDIMIFELPLIEKQWTKRDAFILMDCDEAKYTDDNQRLASFILIKKSDFTVMFINEYLKFCEDPRILTDQQNVCRKDNYDCFIDHRHDQSILSLLSKKYDLKAFRDPSEYGTIPENYIHGARKMSTKDILYKLKDYPNSSYPEIIRHCRSSNIKSYKLKIMVKKCIPGKILKYYFLKF